MANVLLEKIRKEYDGGVVAVKDVTIEVNDKEFVVLVGPSGCGKSTTLRMVAGLEDISGGTLRIDGKIMNDVPPKDRDIAMVFQNYALYPHMSVYENMAFGLKLRKFPKEEIDKRVKEAAKILNIEEYLDRKPKALSGGQRQRVAVGRAIVRKPKVFLFDEPLSNLDAKMRVQMRTEISKLHQRLGATMIYVTHDQTEAMTMGDRIVVMKDGNVMQTDMPLNLYNNPANKFVAGFIGSPAMNFINGKITREKGLKFVEKGTTLSIDIPKEKQKILSGHIDRDIWLGIRPEHIRCEKSRTSRIAATVDVVEPMGNEMFVYFTCGNSQLVARMTPMDIEAGEKRDFSVDTDHIHFFDAATEMVIR
ncbi:MAG: ABC transporter ATP-binding protein [Bacteroidota bacterium]